MFHEEDDSFLDRYHEWEAKYDDFLSRVESDSYQGGTLLNVVSEKEKLLREYTSRICFCCRERGRERLVFGRFVSITEG